MADVPVVGPTVDVKPGFCPHCGAFYERGAVLAEPNAEAPGPDACEVLMCPSCAGVMAKDGDGVLQALDQNTVARLRRDYPNFRVAQDAVQAFVNSPEGRAAREEAAARRDGSV